MMQVEVVRHRVEDVVVVRVSGEVDIATVAGLADALESAAAGAPRAVVCDLCDVSYFGMAAGHCLERAADDLHAVGAQLHLVVSVAAPTPVLRLMTPIWGWPTHHDVSDAVRSVMAR